IPAPDTPPEIRSITVTLPLSIDDLIGSAGEGIGKYGGRQPKDGPLDKLGNLGKGLAGGAALGALGIGAAISSLFSSSSGKNRILPPNQDQSDGFLEWAQKNWEHLFDTRKREIDKLLKRFQDNPDEGLKYALPLAGGEGGRGIAPPSSRLGPRSLNFSMGGGSGPTDYWDLSYEHRQRLEEQYRAAARRELERGNYKRAAYIYGNLLGDWNQAASALEKHGQLRDAISIHLHKLKNPRAAADCYARAKMFTQAAELYEKSGALEKAGDMHDQAGNQDRAHALWIKAAGKEKAPLSKARIWSEKLQQDAIALEILDQHWQKGNNSVAVLDKMFQLLQNSSQSAGAIELGNRVLDHPRTNASFPLDKKLELLKTAITRWPDDQLNHWLEQQMWQRIGDAVSADVKETPKLLAFLPDLAGHDRLLQRDAQRYTIPRKHLKPTTRTTATGKLFPRAIITIPQTGEWYSLRRTAKGVSYVGTVDGQLTLGEWTLDGNNTCPIVTDRKYGSLNHPTHTAVRGTHTESTIVHWSDIARIFVQPENPLSDLTGVLAVGPRVSDLGAMVLRLTETGSLYGIYYSASGRMLKEMPITIDTSGAM
ncbi:MAG: hypothetical protein AAF226_13950, partial [Verrucomicrobiota bacterium]